MGVPDFTVLVAVDSFHLEELRTVWPTWMRHKPGLRERKWLIVCDLQAVPGNMWHTEVCAWWQQQLAFVFADVPHANFVLWGERPDLPQRERMLNSLVFSVKHIDDPWYLKLDSDLIATGEPNWIDPQWFGGRNDPAIIAPGWGYTKPAAMLDSLDEWASGVRELSGESRPARRVVGSIAKSDRFISYCMFGDTEWTKWAAGLAGERLPVPSQDSFLWYVAERSMTNFRRQKMPGWQHVGGGGRRLKEAVEKVMAA